MSFGIGITTPDSIVLNAQRVFGETAPIPLVQFTVDNEGANDSLITSDGNNFKVKEK